MYVMLELYNLFGLGESATEGSRLIYFYRSCLASCPRTNVASDGHRFNERISADFRRMELRYEVAGKLNVARR